MNLDKDESDGQCGTPELSADEARKKRAYHLALLELNAGSDAGNSDELDAADSTMATLILPGG